MDTLQNIKEIARQIVVTVSGIFDDVEVVVISEEEVIYSDKFIPARDLEIYMPYAKKLIKFKSPYIIDTPGTHPFCQGCKHYGNCAQTLEIAVPFNIEGQWRGYLSLVAFSEPAKQRYLRRKKQVIKFLETMLDIMVSSGKYILAENQAKINFKKLETLINHLDDAVFICDSTGKVISYNKIFTELFLNSKLKSDTTDLNVFEIFDINSAVYTAAKEMIEIDSRECTLLINGNYEHMLISCTPFKSEDFNGTELMFIISYLDKAKNVLFQSRTPISKTIGIMVGSSIQTQKLKETINQFANSPSSVFIQGETGTGKELVARSLHSLGNRHDKAFITVNCSAIPDSLIESELFGYEPGTFTGGQKGGKAGLFELANKGTIFLDEIGDMPIHLQPKILRVLQDHKISRLGGFHPTSLDVRIISATNKDLKKMIRENKFRSDLYYRLNVLPIEIKPLRERLEDFDELIEHFISKYNLALKKNVKSVDPNVLIKLKSYNWPGNVRELENTMEHAINMSNGFILTEEQFPFEIINNIENISIPNGSLKEQLKRKEAEIIHNTLSIYGNKKAGVSQAAKILGISKASLYNKIKEYHL